MAAEITDEFREKMAEWVELKKQLAAARKDMKVLNNREKELNLFIKSYMKSTQIDNVNLRQGKVSYKKTVRSETFSKKIVQEGALDFCKGQEEEVERLMECIKSKQKKVEKDTISLTGIKVTKE
jgi:hypothetical protein